MSVVEPHEAFSIAYVHNLFKAGRTTQNSPKRVRQLFKHLTLSCSKEEKDVLVAKFTASCLVSSQDGSSDSRSTSNFCSSELGAKLLFLVIKFAVSRKDCPTDIEEGACSIYREIVELLCEWFEVACFDEIGDVVRRVEKVLSVIPPGYRCVVIASVRVDKQKKNSEKLRHFYLRCLDALFSTSFEDSLQESHLLNCANLYIGGRFTEIKPRFVLDFFEEFITDENIVLLQPLLFQLIALEANVDATVTEQQIDLQSTNFLESKSMSREGIVSRTTDTKNFTLALAIQNAGPKCTKTQEALTLVFTTNGITPQFIDASSVAFAIIHLLKDSANRQSKMFDTREVLEDWNGKVFAQVISFTKPSLNWAEVLTRFDCDEFHVARRTSLVILSDIIAATIGNRFPLTFLFGKWNKLEAQLSWVLRIIENADVFCLADYAHRAVNVSVLKNPPDESDRAIANWRCLELTEFVLTTTSADQRHVPIVQKILQVAGTTCPDVFLLALFAVSPPVTPIRSTLFQMLIPSLIVSHANAVSVLNVGWNSEIIPRQPMRQMIQHAFVSLYLKGAEDQARLTRILDVAHELKPNGLAELFSSNNLQFIIDLACLASKRDYLKLDKWLEDKFQEHGEAFLKALIHHMERKSPFGATAGQQPPSGSLSQETCVMLMNFVRTHLSTTPQNHQLRSLFSSFAETMTNQVMKESGRSSSVSSSSRSGVPGMPFGDPRMNRGPFQQSSNFNPSMNMMPPISGHQAQQHPSGLGNMFGGSSFGGSQELLRNAQPNMPPFGGNPHALSPSSQMLRSAVPTPPQRQNSSGGGWPLPAANQRTGPPTPSQNMDFRAQLPPTGAQADFSRVLPPQLTAEELTHFSEDIQEEANGYFEQLYSPQNPMTVTDLIKRLKAFKSGSIREQKVLHCVVKNLFDEYRFFQDYPERELRTTAEVYGGIIREGIISNVEFVTAVRKVIESLQSEYGSMLWTFGIVSLNACRAKLCAYPKVCTMIAHHENFSRFPQSIKDYVMAGIRGELPAQAAEGRATPPIWTTPAGSQQPPRSASTDSTRTAPVVTNRTGNSVLSYTNVDTLVAATEKEGAEVDQPSEIVVDKIAFLFNNLSQSNLQSKKEEVLLLIAEQGDPFVRWLAQYIVMKRVSIEQNFQQLYNSFVQAVDHPALDSYIKKETFRNIRILLRSDKRQAASNYSDRQLLKNLGMWLGSITIARNKPIRLTELDLKSLLLEAYYKGQQELLFVVPFIAKILYSCCKSSIFTATCAWIRSILKVLAELHNEPDLKINLKFEIEVLCKELVVDLNSLPLDGVLKDTDKLVRVPQQLSDLKLLARPEVPSPVPSQMRLVPDAAVSTPTGETKSSTPAPEAESAVAPSEPTANHFSYHDINVLSFEGLTPHLKIQANLPLFQVQPTLKHVVRPAINMAIKELIGPVSERALKIAMTVTENMIRKDFALDPDEKNMKMAAFHMMRAMTAGMAMITCRDPLTTAMQGYLQNAFQSSLKMPQASPEFSKMMEEAAQTITLENVELATNFIVKSACERAATEMEKRLEPDYSKRVIAKRDGGEGWKDAAAVKIQQDLPEKIAVPIGPTSREHMGIYEQFSSRICGFKAAGAEETSEVRTMSLKDPSAAEMEQMSMQLNHIVKEIDSTMAQQPHHSNKAYNAVGGIRDLLCQLASNSRDPSIVLNLIRCSIEHFLHAFHVEPSSKNMLDIEWPRRLRDLIIGVCRVLCQQVHPSELARLITMTIVNTRVENKWNLEAMEVLLKNNYLQLSILDQHLAKNMDGGSNLEATIFAQRFMRTLSVNAGATEALKMQALRETMPLTFDQWTKVQQLQRAAAPSGETTLEQTLASQDITSSIRNEDSEMTQKVEMILREWIGLCYSPQTQRNPQEALQTMITLMHEQGVLSTDEKISSFFRLCTEMCVDVSLRLLKSDNPATFHQATIVRQRCYYTLDAFVKLMALLVKFSEGSPVVTPNKVALLKKLMSIISSVLHIDHEVRKSEFNAMPYHRILITLFNELVANENGNCEPIGWNMLEVFGQTLFALQPRRVPGFAYAWLDIVGHRNVIGRLLGGHGVADSVEPAKTQAMYTQLLICHLKFLYPYLRNIHLPKSIAVLYKGTLRVLLVILHDFPELLCEYHYVICDTIPPNCVQLRNLVLSAYPRNMRLPDPFALNFKQVDGIPEMAIEPKSNLNMASIIPDNIRLELDEYLAKRSTVEFLTSLRGLLQTSQTPGSKYNTTVMNAVVLYVGIRAINSLHERRQRISISTIAHTAFMDVFQNLAVGLCTEGRYLLFNAIANQLRYPNAHTHYFSCVFLFLFLNSDCAAIQEQITRILFERLVALRPHPWGLLITFIELIKNPNYQFWNYEFTRCAPEIERLFQNVANTCVATNRNVDTPATLAAAKAS